LGDMNLLAAVADGNEAAGCNEIRQINGQKSARPVTAIAHLKREIIDKLGQRFRAGFSKTLRETELDRILPPRVFMDEIGKQTHVFRDGSHRFGRRLTGKNLQL